MKPVLFGPGAKLRPTQAPNAVPGGTTRRALRYSTIAAVLAIMCLCVTEPALANKFETIGGGLSGSSSFKRNWLTRFLVISGSLSLAMGLLALIFPHKNAAYLNYGNWKLSALVLFALGGGFFLFATLL